MSNRYYDNSALVGDYYDGNSPLMANQYYPGLHVLGLPKANGQPVQASWSVRNISTSTTSYATLVLQLVGHNDVTGPVKTVGPGATISLGQLSLMVSGQTAGATIVGDVAIVETTSAGNFIRTVAQHGFTILISGGQGMLEAVGDPQIT